MAIANKTVTFVLTITDPCEPPDVVLSTTPPAMTYKLGDPAVSFSADVWTFNPTVADCPGLTYQVSYLGPIATCSFGTSKNVCEIY